MSKTTLAAQRALTITGVVACAGEGSVDRDQRGWSPPENMNTKKRERLEKAGFVVCDSPQDWLDLSDQEMALIDVQVALAKELRRIRGSKRLSQAALAKRMGSGQSRVAKIESADPSVSLELTVRALLYAGASLKDIGTAIAKGRETVPA